MDAAPTFLRAAAVRAARLDPPLWSDAARTLGALGFNALDVPLVWREHERGDGDVSLRDVAGVVDVAERAGLRVVLRLGPTCVPGLAGFGVPERVLRDRAMHALTRRKNPQRAPDPIRLAPVPSAVSRAYRDACARWISAALAPFADALRAGVVARVIVGPTVPWLWHDNPLHLDHHPDGAADLDGDLDDIAHAVDVEARQREGFLRHLARAAEEAGAPAERVFVGSPGAVTASPAACAVARDYGLSLSLPPPRAGVAAIWRETREALAAPRGAHLDVRSGGSAFESPTRARHTVDAARVALAAGARDVSVLMGFGGPGWIGAILDERARPRAHASHWERFLAWAASLPQGREVDAPTMPDASAVAARRAAAGTHPISLSSWSRLGFPVGELDVDAPLADETPATLSRVVETAAGLRRVTLGTSARPVETGGDTLPPGEVSVQEVATSC